MKCERSSWGMWKDTHGPLRTLSKSCWSFLNRPDIRTAFTGWILNTDGETYDLKEPSDGFVDAFIDLMLYINTFPPGTPVNVEWNKNLSCYVLTGRHLRLTIGLCVCQGTLMSTKRTRTSLGCGDSCIVALHLKAGYIESSSLLENSMMISRKGPWTRRWKRH